MNTKSITTVAVLVAGLLGGTRAFADEPQANAAVPPPVPAGEYNVPAQAPTPDNIVYSGQLPSVQQLTQTAKAQGLTIANVVQSATEVSVTYRLTDNGTRTVAYRLLPTDGSAPAGTQAPVVAASSPESVRVVEVAPPTRTVVYRSYDPYYYDPYYYWGPRFPVSLNLGFGWGFGGHYYGGRGWGHGGFHGGHRW